VELHIEAGEDILDSEKPSDRGVRRIVGDFGLRNNRGRIANHAGTHSMKNCGSALAGSFQLTVAVNEIINSFPGNSKLARRLNRRPFPELITCRCRQGFFFFF